MNRLKVLARLDTIRYDTIRYGGANYSYDKSYLSRLAL